MDRVKEPAVLLGLLDAAAIGCVVLYFNKQIQALQTEHAALHTHLTSAIKEIQKIQQSMQQQGGNSSRLDGLVSSLEKSVNSLSKQVEDSATTDELSDVRDAGHHLADEVETLFSILNDNGFSLPRRDAPSSRRKTRNSNGKKPVERKARFSDKESPEEDDEAKYIAAVRRGRESYN
jgi:hypothetical protein